jgi:NAD(P)-dependent dehydrogenase (short-subunit alcohol dehydrogenase family)
MWPGSATSPSSLEGAASSVVADISSAEDARRLGSEVAERHGQVSVLVNCAGIHELGTTQTADEERWQRQIAINLTGIFLVCKAILPLLTARRCCGQPGIRGRTGQLSG